jgi:hypothetical protein
MMVPRALFTRDVIWLTGSSWGSMMMGWGVMLSLFLGEARPQSIKACDSYLSTPGLVSNCVDVHICTFPPLRYLTFFPQINKTRTGQVVAYPCSRGSMNVIT